MKDCSSKTIARCLKVHGRLSGNDAAMKCIAALDDEFEGSKHFFGSLNGLEVLAVKTHINGNPATSSALLSWTASLLQRDVAAGNLSADAPPAKLTAAIHKNLLKRRLVQYLLRKMRVPLFELKRFAQGFRSRKGVYCPHLSPKPSLNNIHTGTNAQSLDIHCR